MKETPASDGVLVPILGFAGGVAGMIGGTVLGEWLGTLAGSPGIGQVLSGILLFALAIGGYMWGAALGRRGKPLR